MFISRLFQLSPVALVLCLAGCDAAGPPRVAVFKTAGSVTFNNRPLAGAFIVLHPKDAAPADAPRPTAHVQPDGSFETTTFENGDGAPAGEYVVTVQWHQLVRNGNDFQPGPNLLPPKYSDPAKSNLIVRVAEGRNELPPIVLR